MKTTMARALSQRVWQAVFVAASFAGAAGLATAQTACCPVGAPFAMCTEILSMEVVADPYVPLDGNGTPREVMAVEASICDSTGADRVGLCGHSTALVGSDGQIVARLAYLPEYEGGASWPRDPRQFKVRLLFSPASPDMQPSLLRMAACRYRLSTLSLAWAMADAEPEWPIDGRGEGITVTVEGMQVASAHDADEVDDEVRAAGEHLQVTVTGETVVSDVDAPQADWARLSIGTLEDARPLYPDFVYTDTKRTRTASGLCLEQTRATYHFVRQTELPRISGLRLVVDRWLPVNESWTALP